MKSKIKNLFAVAMIAATLSSCMTTEHTVGQGPQGPQTVQSRQWYVLWGLVPINNVESKVLAAGKENYKIKTQVTPLDVIINAVTGIATVYSQTIEVQY